LVVACISGTIGGQGGIIKRFPVEKKCGFLRLKEILGVMKE
jgi:hypothetical protein